MAGLLNIAADTAVTIWDLLPAQAQNDAIGFALSTGRDLIAPAPSVSLSRDTRLVPYAPTTTVGGALPAPSATPGRLRRARDWLDRYTPEQKRKGGKNARRVIEDLRKNLFGNGAQPAGYVANPRWAGPYRRTSRRSRSVTLTQRERRHCWKLARGNRKKYYACLRKMRNQKAQKAYYRF